MIRLGIPPAIAIIISEMSKSINIFFTIIIFPRCNNYLKIKFKDYSYLIKKMAIDSLITNAIMCLTPSSHVK